MTVSDLQSANLSVEHLYIFIDYSAIFLLRFMSIIRSMPSLKCIVFRRDYCPKRGIFSVNEVVKHRVGGLGTSRSEKKPYKIPMSAFENCPVNTRLSTTGS
jgi:hypothetical protein